MLLAGVLGVCLLLVVCLMIVIAVVYLMCMLCRLHRLLNLVTPLLTSGFGLFMIVVSGCSFCCTYVVVNDLRLLALVWVFYVIYLLSLGVLLISKDLL